MSKWEQTEALFGHRKTPAVFKHLAPEVLMRCSKVIVPRQLDISVLAWKRGEDGGDKGIAVGIVTGMDVVIWKERVK